VIAGLAAVSFLWLVRGRFASHHESHEARDLTDPDDDDLIEK
jgi:hypothetical protein